MSPSPSVEAAIDRWVGRLQHVYDRLLSCTVVVEMPHHHHARGNTFHVRIGLGVPGLEIAVTSEPEHDASHADVYIAVSDAFRAARRQLQQHAEIRRGDVKHHAV